MALVEKLQELQYSAAFYTAKNIIGIDSEYFIFFYAETGTGYGTAVVGRFDGTDITMGTPAVFNATYTNYLECIKLTDGSFIIGFNNTTAYAVVQSVLADTGAMSLSFGTSEILNPVNTSNLSLCSLGDNKFASAFGSGYMRVGSFNLGSITLGTLYDETSIISDLNNDISSNDGLRVLTSWNSDSQWYKSATYNVSGVEVTAGSLLTDIVSGAQVSDGTFSSEGLEAGKFMLFSRETTNTIRSNLVNWVSDGLELVVDDTQVIASDVYDYNLMFDSVVLDSETVNIAFITTDTPNLYKIEKITIVGSVVTQDAPVTMINTGLGLGAIDKLDKYKTISSLSSDFMVVATSGVDYPVSPYAGKQVYSTSGIIQNISGISSIK